VVAQQFEEGKFLIATGRREGKQPNESSGNILQRLGEMCAAQNDLAHEFPHGKIRSIEDMTMSVDEQVLCQFAHGR
jgi:hypothetical protein